MDKFLIQGGVPLEGEIAVSGSKNSALPALAACLLTAEKVTLDGFRRCAISAPWRSCWRTPGRA